MKFKFSVLIVKKAHYLLCLINSWHEIVVRLLLSNVIAISAELLYQEVMENSLRELIQQFGNSSSGRSRGKVRENESRKKVGTLLVSQKTATCFVDHNSALSAPKLFSNSLF